MQNEEKERMKVQTRLTEMFLRERIIGMMEFGRSHIEVFLVLNMPQCVLS